MKDSKDRQRKHTREIAENDCGAVDGKENKDFSPLQVELTRQPLRAGVTEPVAQVVALAAGAHPGGRHQPVELAEETAEGGVSAQRLSLQISSQARLSRRRVDRLQQLEQAHPGQTVGVQGLEITQGLLLLFAGLAHPLGGAAVNP